MICFGVRCVVGCLCLCLLSCCVYPPIAGSLMSVGSGVLFGTLLAYGAYRTSVNPRDCLFILGIHYNNSIN